MISFKYFFWSALLGGVIGGVLGAMLTLQIFDDQRRDAADEDEDREALHPAADMRLQQEATRDYPGESLSNTITYLYLNRFNWVSFLFFSSTFLFLNYLSTDIATLYTLAENSFQ